MRRRGQEGYALLVLLAVLAVLVIGLARAVPSWKTEIRRERESRMIDHARQYREAIKRYYHVNGRYPASVDMLLQQDGHGIRYLRQQFLDPLEIAEGGQFDVLHYGQSVNDEIVDQPPAALLNQLQGGIGAAGIAGEQPKTPATTPTDGGQGGLNGINTGLSGGAPAGGGGPVIGVVSKNKQQSVHSFHGFTTPDHWEFVYNFAMDRTLRTGVPGGAVQPGAPRPPQSPPSPGGGGSGSGTGNGPGGGVH